MLFTHIPNTQYSVSLRLDRSMDRWIDRPTRKSKNQPKKRTETQILCGVCDSRLVFFMFFLLFSIIYKRVGYVSYRLSIIVICYLCQSHAQAERVPFCCRCFIPLRSKSFACVRVLRVLRYRWCRSIAVIELAENAWFHCAQWCTYVLNTCDCECFFCISRFTIWLCWMMLVNE